MDVAERREAAGGPRHHVPEEGIGFRRVLWQQTALDLDVVCAEVNHVAEDVGGAVGEHFEFCPACRVPLDRVRRRDVQCGLLPGVRDGVLEVGLRAARDHLVCNFWGTDAAECRAAGEPAIGEDGEQLGGSQQGCMQDAV